MIMLLCQQEINDKCNLGFGKKVVCVCERVNVNDQTREASK